MKSLKRGNKMILVPYPAQGHVTPMLKLASALLNHGFEPVVVTPEFIHSRIANQVKEISCISIPDGLEEDTVRDFFAIEMAMENNMPLHLERVVREFLGDVDGRVCMVVDVLASWAIDVADKCGVQVAGFWPAMLATYRLIAAIPVMIRTGIISQTGNPKEQGAIFLPGQPVLSTEDLPWLIGTITERSSRFKFWIRTLNRLRTLRWLLVNSIPDELHDNNQQNDQLIITDGSQDYTRVFPVGPLMEDNKLALSKNASFWAEDMSCLDWLDMQSPGSVVYVSFGSWVSPIGERKVKNLALALEASRRPFLWVLGSACCEGLPLGFLDRVWRQGKVVSWAPQIRVLQHKAVGCYLTHCGWNSTMEAIQCKKRLVCYPVAGDQFINCAYIVKVWRIGARISEFGQKEVEESLKRVVEDNEMKHTLMRLNERLVGKEARSRALANLAAFANDIKKSFQM
ncbi:UDP-glycosyltransferase 82A1 [Cornus florida]|uniref:UDP-glycosyltransferase 82A1 n=1 Tax=Cornus florida TaxID=4283 RepID=UPI0028A02D41|nr:UDP-glycosyltransferase 82A1 [Cornus florida]